MTGAASVLADRSGALAVLADKSGEAAKAGPIGLVVILVLCIACYFLFKSMSKHMRRVREDWPATDAGPGPAAPTVDLTKNATGSPAAAETEPRADV